ncbi:hypothetical protein MTO96_001773 [Rhipicephalus appendiculatus]
MWRFLRGCRTARSGRIYHRAPVGALGGVSALVHWDRSINVRPGQLCQFFKERGKKKTTCNNVAAACLLCCSRRALVVVEAATAERKEDW